MKNDSPKRRLIVELCLILVHRTVADYVIDLVLCSVPV
jgi:hypothetical protein